MRVLGGVLAVALCVAVGGCTDRSSSPGAQPSPAWTATFEQDRPDQASRDADVKLTNLRDVEVTVEGVRLRWSGYQRGPFQPADMTYAAGHIHRLDVRLPPPWCDDTPDDPPRVETRLAGGATDTATLDASGAALLRRLWQQDCAEHRLRQAVHLRLERWRLVRRHGELVLLGDLAARRGSSAAAVRLTETRGSVLLEFQPDGTDHVLLRRGERRGRLPVVIRSIGRCDPHALGQSTQTFTMRMWLSLDGGPAHALVTNPEARTRALMQDVLADDCGLRHVRP
jgi:hypothetical protein